MSTMSSAGRSSQFEHALLTLRSLILTGAFAAESRLPEVALSERIGVSRTPLRRALERLAEEGLLERRAGGGCQVARFSRDDISDAIEIRGVLEGTAARLAAERGVEPARLDECREVLGELDATMAGDDDQIDFEGYARLNARFHKLMALLAGSRMVERQIERANRLPLASPSAFVQGQPANFLASLRVAQHQHWALLDAIEGGEGARAEALAREHARLARSNLDHLDQVEPSLIERLPGLALVAT